MSENTLTDQEVIAALKEEMAYWKKLALMDSLTGLPNRLAFLNQLGEALRHSRDTSTTTADLFNNKAQADKRGLDTQAKIAVAFIDLDKFKYINDTYGHDAGDAVLSAVGTFLKSSLRDEDTVTLYEAPHLPPELAGRLGGDEFVMILPHTDSKQIQNRKNKIEEDLNKIVIDYKGIQIEVHGSMAVMDCDPNISPEQNLAIVDAKMYERKLERKAKAASYSDPIPSYASVKINGVEQSYYSTTAAATLGFPSLPR